MMSMDPMTMMTRTYFNVIFSALLPLVLMLALNLKPDRRNERPEPSHSRLRGEIRVHEHGIVLQSNTVALKEESH